MPASEFDINNIHNILLGSGTNFSAEVIRFLNKVIFKTDGENFRKLWTMFPTECSALYRHYGWSDAQIKERLIMAGIYAGVI